MGPKKGKKAKKSEKPTEEDEEQRLISEAKKQKVLMEQMNYLGKLRIAMEEAEEENKSLRNEIRQVERDRTDIIMYLRRRLGEKCEEALELEERNKSLSEERANEEEEFKGKMKAKEHKYNEMVERLTIEMKELNNRLANLEEYRAQRNLLLDKNNKLESYLQTMEARSQSIEKEYEKANLIDKERMRREMEEKLLKFSVDFQKATKARIASATQNVIKENIAINNELALLIQSWQKLHDQNESLISKNRYLSNEIATEKALREKLMHKNEAQAKLIDTMAYEYMKVDEFHKEVDQLRRIVKNLQERVAKKESAIAQSKSEAYHIKQEIIGLNERYRGLDVKASEMYQKHERNTSLLNAVNEELLGEVHSGLGKKQPQQGSLGNMTEDALKKYEHLFGRLAVLFDKDWLLEVTPGVLASEQSIATVVGPFLKTYEESPCLHDTLDHTVQSVHEPEESGSGTTTWSSLKYDEVNKM